jgi:hypothetical protein
MAVVESSGAGFPIAPVLARLGACMMPAARFHHSLRLPAPSCVLLPHQVCSQQREPGQVGLFNAGYLVWACPALR